jgi:hypothetical protein
MFLCGRERVTDRGRPCRKVAEESNTRPKTGQEAEALFVEVMVIVLDYPTCLIKFFLFLSRSIFL